MLPPSLHTQLLRDMQHWLPNTISKRDLIGAPESDTRAAVGIINGTVFWLRRSESAPRNGMLDALVQDLVTLVSEYAVPDVALIVNVFDEPVVPLARHPRPPPVFSFFQTRAAADIVMPDAYFRRLRFDCLPDPAFFRSHYPWDSKLDTALWRGSLFCGPNRFLKCPRLLLAHLSAQNASRMLDVRLTSYNADHDVVLATGREDSSDLPAPARPLQTAPRLAIEEHARSRYLIHLDGFTASSRLQLLLRTNSVVLRMDSYFWPHFASAFRPHVHYIPFWETSPTDVLSVLRNLSQPKFAPALRRLGERASVHAHRVLSRRARSLYWLVLLGLYKRRLRGEVATLERWPGAKPVRATAAAPRCDHPSTAAAEGACDTARTRRADEAAVSRLVDELDGKLTAATLGGSALGGQRQHGHGHEPATVAATRPRAYSALPEGGDASVGLAFESDAERRAMPPERDHDHLAEARARFPG